ncbi:hypothetical protein LCGC14_2498430 [marine sediment metagenome]|uniref:N-acetyltransferase domain-containing protein n=1 Tax=marine sediment metagenome TaxID=412755 RepID=A0A0F9B3B8_9ZZZZ
MITGTIHETLALTTPSGRSVTVQILTPDGTLPNATEIRKQEQEWEAKATAYEQQRLDPMLINRSHFAAEVLFLAAQGVQQKHPGILLSQDLAGRILGVLLYTLPDPPRRTRGTISLMAIDPTYLAGSPGSDQLRGIGTTLTMVVGQIFVARDVPEVCLHPLDEAAHRFWQGRGFPPRTPGGPACIRGPVEVAQLAARCGHEHPDLPDQGDSLFVGSFEATERVRLPRLKGLY